MFCQKCGTQNPDDGKFCSKCGNDLSIANQSIKEKQANVIGIGSILSWLFGGLFLLAGVGWLFQKVIVGIPLLLISIVIFPPITKRLKEKFNFEISRPLKIVTVIILLSIASANISDTTNQTGANTIASKSQLSQNIISSSFSDYGNVYCDEGATTLQKETLFNDKFKNKYVKWTGTVSSVAESWGSYKLQVKHCSKTLISDVVVTMKDDQKNKLMQLREGDIVTYIAKLTSYGEILDISAEDGVIVQ